MAIFKAKLEFDRKRLIRVAAILLVALGAGQLVQQQAAKKAAQRPAAVASQDEVTAKPKVVVTLAAGPDAAAPAAPADTPPAAAPAVTAKAEIPAEVAKPEAPGATVLAAAAITPLAPAPATKPATSEPVPVAATPETPAQPLAPAEPVQADCPVTLDLLAQPGAMLGMTLVAPCHGDERIVLKHAGLAVTAHTTATGAFFGSLPALDQKGEITVAFADGTKAEAALAVPELATLRRFGVQWQGDDAFAVNAFEGIAGYGEPGHIHAANPKAAPMPGLAAEGGWLTLLGDADSDLPLLAQIYTFPADPAAVPDVTVEAEVADATCGRELLGETLTSIGGEATITELTLVMPGCEAKGDFLVLKNLVPDLKIAAN